MLRRIVSCCAILGATLACPFAVATQVVFLDFDSRTTGGEHQYTTFERSSIQTRMENDYALFDYSFTQTQPGSGDYSTLFMNSGPGLGIAEQIDFRNLDQNDTAEINVNGSASGTTQYILLTANVASHELGHLAGLRHADSFGPLGAGRDPNSAAASDYRPNYTGPAGADETRFHIMESDNNPGGFLEGTSDQYFSERSAIKLTFNEFGTVISEAAGNNNSIANAQPIELFNMPVPNTLLAGDNMGLDLFVDAVVVTGSRSTAGDDDYYSFQGLAGELFNMEIISEAIDHRFGNTIDSTLTLFGPTGGQVAFNDDETEGFDSILLDFVLPSDGIYTVMVDAFNANDTGNYELFIYRLTDAPEPEGLAGDYNGDMIVDLADYTVWRDNEGASGDPGLMGDGSGSTFGVPDGVVDALDYDFWRANFGNVGPASLTTAGNVPEPTSLALVFLAAGLGCIVMRNRCGSC